MTIQYVVVLALCIFAVIIGFVSATRSGSVARRRLFALNVAIACFTVAATGFIGVGFSFRLFLLVVLVALPAFGLGMIAILAKRRRARTLLLSLAGFIALAFLVSGLFGTLEISASKSYCESLAGDLEAYKASHGRYPDNLAEIEQGLRLKPLKALFHGDNLACGYENSIDAYSFRIPSSGSFPSYWEYRSNAQVWSHHD